MSRTAKDTPQAKDRFLDRENRSSEIIARRYIRLGLDNDTSLTYQVV